MKKKIYYYEKIKEIHDLIQREEVFAQQKGEQPNWHDNYKTIHLETISMLESAGFNAYANELIKSSIMDKKPSKMPIDIYKNYKLIINDFNDKIKDVD